MDSDSAAILRADIAALRGNITEMRQDISTLEAKSDSLEAWRVRYLVQEDQVISKLFAKIDELVTALGDMRADLSRIRGERDAERRLSMMIISLLSAVCGGLIGSFYHG
jgi:predicted RNase H-like nuclease (RuvC/YqgF family)